jgi:hypothetical protein
VHGALRQAVRDYEALVQARPTGLLSVRCDQASH